MDIMDTQKATVTAADSFGRVTLLTERNEALLLYTDATLQRNYGVGDNVTIERHIGKRRATDWRIV